MVYELYLTQLFLKKHKAALLRGKNTSKSEDCYVISLVHLFIQGPELVSRSRESPTGENNTYNCKGHSDQHLH